jgi:hypothetical protein
MVGMIAAQFNAERLRSIDGRITNRNLVCMVRLQLPGCLAACLSACLPQFVLLRMTDSAYIATTGSTMYIILCYVVHNNAHESLLADSHSINRCCVGTIMQGPKVVGAEVGGQQEVALVRTHRVGGQH